MAPVTAAAPAGPGTERWVFPPTPPMSTYITAIAAGPYHVVTAEHDGIPLGIYCRQSLAAYLDPDEIFEVTRQGFDYFHETFGVRYPFGKYDQLFVPEYKAGRDGERRLRDVPRGLHLPVPGHRVRAGDPRRDDPARDGPHVVRRPGHHALVGRPVAERVVRHLGGHGRAGRGHPLAGRLDHVRPGLEGVGVPAGPAALHPPDRGRRRRTSRRSRSTSTASPTPRARPCSSSWSPTSGGTTSWPASAPTSASTPGATPPWPTCSAP